MRFPTYSANNVCFSIVIRHNVLMHYDTRWLPPLAYQASTTNVSYCNQIVRPRCSQFWHLSIRRRDEIRNKSRITRTLDTGNMRV